MTTALAVIVDASVVSTLALLVCQVLRRKPAALRHLILAASLAAAAAAPVLEAALPHWDLPLLSSSAQVTSSGLALSSELSTTAAVEASAVSDAPHVAWTDALAAVWAIGFVAVIVGLLAGLARLVSMTRRCRPVLSSVWKVRADALSAEHGLLRPVAVLECPDRALLLTWGLFRPRIIVPEGAHSWSVERIDAVLAHELAHVVRRDWALQIAAEAVRAMHWFNPLVWIACRCLREESEQACDDAVLRRGLEPVAYASHLLAVARQLVVDGRTWASAPAVADPSTLERRIAAMLNGSRTHATLTRTSVAVALLAMLALTIPVAAITLTERLGSASIATGDTRDIVLTPPVVAPTVPAAAVPRPRRIRPAAAAAAAAQQKPGSISGTLRDASGAVLPGVQLTLTNTASGIKYSAVSSNVGAFSFRDLAPSRYELTARLPGFASLLAELTLGSGEELQRGMEMKVGGLQESVTVSCPVGTAALRVVQFQSVRGPSPALFGTLAAQALPVRVGGQIAAPRQTKKVAPVCPGSLPSDGYTVILESTIDADGMVRDIKTLRPRPGEQQAIVQTAIDAIRQWEFTPTRLNNVPIPVIMTVTVQYTR